MKKIKILLLFVAMAALASCGIFKKDCGCPHFGKAKSHTVPAANIS
jgi:hypothetical protein